MPIQEYKDFELGVINAVKATRLPLTAFARLQNFYQLDEEIKKMPGLTEINPTAMGSNSVPAVFVFHKIAPKQTFRMAVSGTSLLKFDEGSKTFTSVYSGIIDDGLIEFLEFQNRLYFGSQNNKWRVFDGGTTTQPVGGSNGNASDAPKKFSMIVFSPYTGRFFAIGDKENPDYLYHSAHIDNEGIESFTDTPQITDSIRGDSPQFIDIYEGRITFISEKSIGSGSVVGVPQAWEFVREKALTGTIARRSCKRRGNNFYYLTKDFEICSWPENKIITEGRVKFSINPNKAHLACAEIVEDRYYDICFESGEAVSSDKYHWWRYDILADRWSGPHRQRNIVSMYYDDDNRVLLCGGADNLAGYVMELRGHNIKNTAMKCIATPAYSDYGNPIAEKRYSKFWLTSSQEGNAVGNQGNLEVVWNSDGLYGNPQSQLLTLQDPTNQNLSNTGSVKESITKRAFIHDAYGRGTRGQWELKHEILNGDFSFSQVDVEYNLLNYKKENR